MLYKEELINPHNTLIREENKNDQPHFTDWKTQIDSNLHNARQETMLTPEFEPEVDLCVFSGIVRIT